MSGHGNESKYKTLALLPEKLRPKTIKVNIHQDINTIELQIKESNLSFPLILKPDIGFRGLGVFKVTDSRELKERLVFIDKRLNGLERGNCFLIQEYINLKEEFAVFYHINRDDKKGTISSLTQKEFLQVLGDGKSNISQLIECHPRARFYKTALKKEGFDPKYIPKKGEKFRLSDIGNHSRGSRFINITNLINADMEAYFTSIVKDIPNFNYGRFDLKCNSIEDLENGNALKIIELNGIVAEPVHIYDSQNFSYLKALKSLQHHWNILDSIIDQQTVIKDKKLIPTKVYLREMKSLYNYKKQLESRLL
jgi:D-alanine-D-alanine ligase-like ATP-grasp enzyme